MVIAEFLAKDGLVLGVWVTVPDPWQDKWPFARRHPGRRPAPEPSLTKYCRRAHLVLLLYYTIPSVPYVGQLKRSNTTQRTVNSRHT